VGRLFRINKLLRLTSNNLPNCNNVVVSIADRVHRDKGVAAGSFADELLSFVDVCRVHKVWLHKRYFRLWSCTFDIMHIVKISRYRLDLLYRFRSFDIMNLYRITYELWWCNRSDFHLCEVVHGVEWIVPNSLRVKCSYFRLTALNIIRSQIVRRTIQLLMTRPWLRVLYIASSVRERLLVDVLITFKPWLCSVDVVSQQVPRLTHFELLLHRRCVFMCDGVKGHCLKTALVSRLASVKHLLTCRC
jgi:hypothetical protein